MRSVKIVSMIYKFYVKFPGAYRLVSSGEFIYPKISTTSASGSYTATSSRANYSDYDGSNTQNTLPSLVMYFAKTAVLVLYGETSGGVLSGKLLGAYRW